jgi:hypothetical protein
VAINIIREVMSPLDRLTPLVPIRDHGAAWRHANCGHVSLGQLKVMSAIERCRTAALGGHVARCEDCAHTTIAYNSCRNRHCPKCSGLSLVSSLMSKAVDLVNAVGLNR